MARLVSTGKKYTEARNRVSSVRDDLDAEIVKARGEGVTFARIAEDIGMSVAWVQVSIRRSATRARAATKASK